MKRLPFHSLLLRIGFLLSGLIGGSTAAFGAEAASESGHANPVSTVLISLVVILLSAKFGGALAERFRQPAVLGELMFGVVLGNLTLVGFTAGLSQNQ